MQNIIKDILIAQMSFPLKYKNEKEIWWEDEYGHHITVEIIDAENEQYVVRRYWRSGPLSNEDNYYKGQRHGEYLVWHENGQLWYRENYHQGKLHDECLIWYDNGKPLNKKKYNHGELISAKYY